MKTILPPLSLALSLLLAGAGSLQAAEAIPVHRVETVSQARSYRAEAVVEAVRSATVAAQVQGRVLETRVDAGDAVRQGAMLARIDGSELVQAAAAARAQAAQVDARAVNARADLERTRSLFARKFVSQSALDQAEAAARAAEAGLQAARASAEQASAAAGYTTVTAPMGGLVAERHAQVGDMAQPGRPLFTVYDPAALRVVAALPQARLEALRQGGLKARVEFPDSGRWVDAAAVTVLPAADPQTHTTQVRVDLPTGLDGVVPGKFARVHFATTSAVDVRILIPAAAVLRRGELTGAYVRNAQGGWSLRQLRVGEADAEGRVEVLAGLKGGEELALDPVRAGLQPAAAR